MARSVNRLLPIQRQWANRANTRLPDRTNLFISYRQSYTHHPAKRTRLTGASGYRDDVDSERAGLMSNQDAGNDAVIEMDLLPPRWLDIQDEISTILSEVGTKMKKLDQLHAKHVLPGFDDESVKAQEERLSLIHIC